MHNIFLALCLIALIVFGMFAAAAGGAALIVTGACMLAVAAIAVALFA